MKTKPKYFIVESDLNNPLWFVYIKWINETYNQNWAGDTSKFYGYDGNKFNNGTDGCDLIKSFENNPILLTLNQWYQLFIAPKKIYSISEIENNLKLIIYLDSEKEYKQLSKFINRLCPWYGKRCYSLRKGNYSSLLLEIVHGHQH